MKSIHQVYWYSIVCNFITIIGGISVAIFFIFDLNETIESWGRFWGIIFILFITSFCLVCSLSAVKSLSILFKDFNSVKNKNYISIIGKVIKFKKNISLDSGSQVNNEPIVLILDTNEKIELIVNDKIMVGETYKFNYLKNSKIAEIVESIK